MVTRTTEIKQLEKLYASNRGQVVLVYGARGCLKEDLIKAFCKTKRAFYYRGRNVSPELQIQEFVNDIKTNLNIDVANANYDACFEAISSRLGSDKIVVVDDFEYIAKKDESFIKALNKYKKDMFIILGSTALSWINNDLDKVMGTENAIDKRIKLNEVGFLDIVRAFPKYSVEESVTVYGILGGVASYLNRWNQSKSFKQNVCDNILSNKGYLFNEANEFLGSELRELTVYNTILASLASGNEKLNDLYNATGYSRAKISVYLKNLAAFDVIEKVVSFETGGWDNAKKGIYRIRNNYINFYYTFVYPHLSQLYVVSPERFYDTYIKNELDTYLQRYFVDVCQEYLELLNKVGQCTIKIEKMGTWLGKSGTIDVVAQDIVRNNVVGECNWKNPELTLKDYENLVESMKKARINAKTIYLFSATAFDKELKDLASGDDSIVLVDMKEL